MKILVLILYVIFLVPTMGQGRGGKGRFEKQKVNEAKKNNQPFTSITYRNMVVNFEAAQQECAKLADGRLPTSPDEMSDIASAIGTMAWPNPQVPQSSIVPSSVQIWLADGSSAVSMQGIKRKNPPGTPPAEKGVVCIYTANINK